MLAQPLHHPSPPSSMTAASATGPPRPPPLDTTHSAASPPSAASDTSFLAPVSDPHDHGIHLRGRVADLVAHAPDLCRSLGIAAPVDFPAQGAGADSEFCISAPIWSKQPFKVLYFVYFGVSLGFIQIPWWCLTSLPRSGRGHRSWSWRRALLVKIYQTGSSMTFRTHFNLGRDLTRAVPHSATKYGKFAWLNQVPLDQAPGEIRRCFALQGLKWSDKVPGFWFGDHRCTGGCRPGFRSKVIRTIQRTSSIGSRPPPEELQEHVHSDQTGCVGMFAPAGPDEQVLLHFHGGAYWIGTSHEQDFTSSVTHEALAALHRLYAQQDAAPTGEYKGRPERQRVHRTFSVDYRLCMPNRPDLGSWPAPLLDAFSSYLYLVRDMGFKPKNIILVGDSAGGNLALALCRYLRDEKIEEVPGRLLLLAPWSDVSRSHSGPLTAPNPQSSVHLNRKSDIIHPSKEYRNTAVSTLLGNLPASEAYLNPYLSPASLQLPLDKGGAGPHYGFEGFPSKVFITTGTAEVSYDQHVTLAHRMAMGTLLQRPLYRGDKCSEHLDPVILAERPSYPRSLRSLVDLGSMAASQASLLGGPHLAPSPNSGWDLDLSRSMSPQAEYTDDKVVLRPPRLRTHSSRLGESDPASSIDSLKLQVLRPHTAGTIHSSTGARSPYPLTPSTSPGTEVLDSAAPIPADAHAHAHAPGHAQHHISHGHAMAHAHARARAAPLRPHPLEDRQVVFHEAIGAVHEYLLFDWFEPERSRTWDEIAHWIDA